MKTPFQKGNKIAVGNKGGGRPLDWLKERCQELVKQDKIVEFIAEGASGNYPMADTDDRLKAAGMLLDRGFGKPMQEVRPVDDQGNYAPFQIFMPAQVSGQEGTSSEWTSK